MQKNSVHFFKAYNSDFVGGSFINDTSPYLLADRHRHVYMHYRQLGASSNTFWLNLPL